MSRRDRNGDDGRTVDDSLRDESERARRSANAHGAAVTSVFAESSAGHADQAQTSTPAVLDDLIAQYVRQMAVSDPSAADPRLMLKLDPTLFPDTELFLIKGAEGWVLQANTRAPAVYRLLAEYGPALERRFATRRLGTLTIESSLDGFPFPPVR